jgi:hypothetical protein
MLILHLTLSKKWFDKIALGKKIQEYREIKPFWTKRFISPCGLPIAYDEIRFRNGYTRNAPWMRVKWLGLMINDKEGLYIIQLGPVLEVCRPK